MGLEPVGVGYAEGSNPTLSGMQKKTPLALQTRPPSGLIESGRNDVL